MRLHSSAFLVSFALIACGPPPVRVDPPTAPDANDPAYTVTGLRSWYLVGNAATPGNDELTVTVAAPAKASVIDLWVGSRPGVRLTEKPAGTFTGTVSLKGLAPGVYNVHLAANGDATGFARFVVTRTHPYYVLMSTDWDFSDPSQAMLDRHDGFHARHPTLTITHFAAPYSFTDPVVTETRRAEIAAFLVRMRDSFGDEIGLHIHPYCNFVTTAGLTCIVDQSVLYAGGDATGYTIKVAAYGETDFGTLLDQAATLFQARGLGKPTTFRAGAWTATIETLRALASRGYVADTSAINWERLSVWNGVGNGELYRWTSSHWAPINDASQPYWPNHDDVLAATEPTLPLLELPDNGVMIDYANVADMKTVFAKNWDGVSALEKPTTLMVGFHPSVHFTDLDQATVDGILDYTDTLQAADDHGPVVYTTLKQMPAVFAK